MVINKKVIEDLKKNNKKISDMLSSISDLKENELNSILKEIQNIKAERTKPKVKKQESSVLVDKKINSSILSISKLIPKTKESKSKKIIDFKNLLPKQNIVKSVKSINLQSQQDFTRHEDDNNIQEEKLKTLKSISSKLDLMKTSTPKENKKSPISSILDQLKGGFLGTVAGGLIGKVKKIGVGKTLGIAMTVKSVFDLIGDIKTGYSDYKKFKALGDNVKADQAIFKAFIGSSGSIVNIVANFVPGPLKFLLYGLGTFLDLTASEFDSVIADKSNTMMQAQIKSDYAKDRLVQGQKFNILQLRPKIKDLTYEYKNYETNSWEPLLDSSGKPLSLASGKKRVEENGSEKGINKYKIKTGGTYADLVLVDGKPKMKMGDKISEISPRRNGGTVIKDNRYLVGETGPEMYQTNELKSKNEFNILRNTFLELNSNFSKLVKNLSVENLKGFFTPEIITSRIRKNIVTGFTGKELLDFSNIPTDDKERFNTFLKQVYKFEGGFSDTTGDIRTNLGITQPIYNKYRVDKKLPVQDVLNISKEEADEAYYNYYYKPSKANEIQDPKLAYAYFDMYVNSPPEAAKRILKESGGDVDKFLNLRDERYKKIAETKSEKAKFLEGWLSRNQTIRNMIQSSKKIVEITSNKEIKSTPIIKKDVVDADFLMKKILPQMAEAVRNSYQ